MTGRKNRKQIRERCLKTLGERYYGGELTFPFKFEDFDCPRPMDMPSRFFPGVKKLKYSSAIKADVSRVRASAWSDMPRCWFIDAWFDCEKCGKEFCWTAKIQQLWFERFQLWSEAYPKLCHECRAKQRRFRQTMSRFGAESEHALLRSVDRQTKEQILELFDVLESLAEEPLPKKFIERRNILKRQIEKM